MYYEALVARKAAAGGYTIEGKGKWSTVEVLWQLATLASGPGHVPLVLPLVNVLDQLVRGVTCKARLRKAGLIFFRADSMWKVSSLVP